MALTKISSNLVADDAIVTGKIADGGVGTADLAANAVTTAKIAQNNVTAHHIADGSVTTTQLGADSVTNAKIADDAISEEHLDKTIISDLTEVTPVAGDFVLLGDTSDSNNLKKAPLTLLLNSNVDISGKADLAGPTFTGDVDIDGSDNLRLRFLNGSTFKGGIQVPTSTGDMISGAAVDDLAIRSQGNILFSSGGNTEMVRIQSTGKVGIGTAAAPDTQLHVKNTGGIELRLEADSNNNGQEDCFVRFYTDGKTQEGIAGMDNNNSSTLFSGNTENGMVFGTVSNLPTLFATNNTQRMIIGADGDVHIGDSGSYTGMFTVNDTTASSNKIIAHFQGQGNGADTTTGGQYISVNRTGPISSASNGVQGGLILGSNSATGPGCAIQSIYQYTNGRDMRFLVTHDNSSDPSVRMSLTGAGQLCIGYTSAQDGAYLSVVSNGGEGIFNGVLSTNAYRRYYHTVSDGIHRFKGSANTATITNAGAWQNASDFAYKEDIQDISYGLDTVKALRPRTFKMKGTDLGDGKGLDQQIGFIAQEVESVVPEVVDGEEGEKTLGYGVLTAVLVKAIQELEARVKELEG